MTASTYMPVRVGHGPLHIAQPTGRGYRAVCGRKLAGPEISVPMPRIDLGRRAREHFWSQCWEEEVICRQCDRAAP